MPLIGTSELVHEAHDRGAAVAAFNVVTLEHAEAVVAAAERTGRPAVLQVSQNAVRFHDGALRPLAAACRELATASTARVSLHLDHVDEPGLLRLSADAGFSSVMFDAGALPYAENVAATADAARWAHHAGLWLEAELGYVGGKASQPRSAHSSGVRTDPDEAVEYVASTGVDALAVAVGSSHAMTERAVDLDAALVRRLADLVPVPLVLHGSSGVRDESLQAAIAAGIAKVNVGTALNVAYTRAVRDYVCAEHGADHVRAEHDVDPRPYLAAARAAMADAAERVLHLVTPA